MGCLHLDGWVGRDGGEGAQLPAACPARGPRLGCPPRPRSTWVPSGWVQRGRPVSPSTGARLCAAVLPSASPPAPPRGRGTGGPSPQPRLPPPPAGAPPLRALPQCTQVGIHKAVYQACIVCPLPTRPRAGSWDPGARCGPCPLGPPSWGWDRNGSHGCVANRFLASSARPWGGAGPKMGHLGPQASGAPWGSPVSVLGVPAQGSCPEGCPASCQSLPAVPGLQAYSRLVTLTSAGGRWHFSTQEVYRASSRCQGCPGAGGH